MADVSGCCDQGAALGGIPWDVAVRLARSLDLTPSAIVVLVDADLTIRWLSSSAAWVTGSDPHARQGSDALDRIHPDDVLRLIHGLGQLRDATWSGELDPLVAGPFRYRFRRFDNDEWVVMEAQVHNLLRDPVVNGLLVVSRPVSGRLDGVGHVIDLLVADTPLPAVLAECANLVPSHIGSAAVVGLLGSSTVIGVARGSPVEPLVADDRWWRRAVEDGMALAPVDFAGFPDDLAAPARAAGFLTAWATPLVDGSTTEVIGCLVVWVRLPGERNVIGDEALRQAERLASLVIGEQRRHFALRSAALTDPLTGLGNRAALRHRLDESDGPVTLAILDLDGFKPINDAYGHDAGDAVLEIVAQRLTASVREGDLVVRFGGDEFAIVVAPGGPADDATTFGKRLVEAVEAPIRLPDGRSVRVGASIGVATAPPVDALRQADTELYRVKQDKQRSLTGRAGR